LFEGRRGRAVLHGIDQGADQRVVRTTGVARVCQIQARARVARIFFDQRFQLVPGLFFVAGAHHHVVDALGDVFALWPAQRDSLQFGQYRRVILLGERTAEHDLAVAIELFDALDQRVGGLAIAHGVEGRDSGGERVWVVGEALGELADAARIL
jgi:hypothetical protein